MNEDLKAKIAKLEKDASKLRADLKKAKAEVNALTAPAHELDWMLPFEPKVGADYWYVDGAGYVESTINTAGYDTECIARGNAFRTKEAAQMYALRCESMKPSMPWPKVGDKVWIALTSRAVSESWDDSTLMRDGFLTGQFHPTKESAEAWRAKFLPAFGVKL